MRRRTINVFLTFSLLLSVFLCSAAGAKERIIVRPAVGQLPLLRQGFLPLPPLQRPRIALVLSGGGARGAAQIGVLKTFERYGIPVDFIVATSMGAIIGGLYASGYTAAEIENIALSTNWDEVLSLGEETERTQLFIDQKIARDRNFLAVRFQGLEPVIPGAVSSGQRLTNFLSSETLQALYHPYPDFDNLKIPFRAIATDLLSGSRVVMGDGSLAEAIRASATTPLLFNPIEKDTLRLIDGGLLANVPVDVARERGYDIVIAVNTTSGLRTSEEMRAPWETVDQLMGITMQSLNQLQLKNADVVITPNVGRHLSYDMRGIDTLIARGEHAAEDKIGEILALYQKKESAHLDSVRVFRHVSSTISGGTVPDSLLPLIGSDSLSLASVQRQVRSLYATGLYRDVQAEIEADSTSTRVSYEVTPFPKIQGVEFEGVSRISLDTLRNIFAPITGMSISQKTSVKVLEAVLRLYREQGYSLARIESTSLDDSTGIVHIKINEGVIHRIEVQGGIRTQDEFVLRDFPLEPGEIFQIDKANRGITNINSTTLFEFVYLEVRYESLQPVITIRLKERPSQLVRIGLRADNERKLQGSIDIRDENFHGYGSELGLTADGGDRNSNVVVEYKVHRLFDTYLTFSASTFFRTYNSYIYTDQTDPGPNRWNRIRTGEYQDVRYGANLVFGSQLERLGNATIELTVQNVRLRNIENAALLEEKYHLAMLRAGSVVDSKDSYPFPSKGVGLELSYEFALDGLGSEVAYNSLKIMYESYSTWGTRHTVHPKITMGFADKTMPLSQQFRLGGRESFFGLREDDRRGRQLLLVNVEYRYLLPVRLLFDTYFRIRYDLGSISAVPEDIKFSTFRHGIGTELALHTPVGPATIGVGKSFYLGKDLPQNPIQQGPLLVYFMIGYQL